MGWPDEPTMTPEQAREAAEAAGRDAAMTAAREGTAPDEEAVEEAEKKAEEDSEEDGSCERCEEDPFEIIISAHLDHAEDWIGHAVITLDVPTRGCKVRERISRGFWPAGTADFSDPDLYWSGVPGTVADDSAYYPTSKAKFSAFKSYTITCAQAKAAHAVIVARQANPGKYSALRRQCATFALEVLNAAGQDIDAGFPARPGVLYNTISGEDLPAGHKSTIARDLREIAEERVGPMARDAWERLRERLPF